MKLNGGPGNSGRDDAHGSETAEQARQYRAFGEDLMDRDEMTAAAEALTRALLLFLELEDKDEVVTTELLLTKVVPDIGPFAYVEIRRAIEMEMGHYPMAPDPGESNPADDSDGPR